MPSSTALVQTLAPGRGAAVDRFLARVAALGPAQWGRLDAIAQRVFAADPIARWQLAGHVTASAAIPPAVQQTLRSFVFGMSVLGDVAGLVRPRRERARRRPPPLPPSANAEARALDAWLRSLLDLHEAQPGATDQTVEVLAFALWALHLRDRVPAATFARLYAPVEAVIPLASVDP